MRECATISRAACLAEGIYELWFKTEKIARKARAGQFISIYCNDGTKLLPRPISICKIEGDEVRVVYRVAGGGTLEFSKMKAGDKLNIQGPLGNGYEIEKIEKETGLELSQKGKHRAILFGGGIGIPPMLELAREVNCDCEIVLGYRDNKTFLLDEFKELDKAGAADNLSTDAGLLRKVNINIATEDGSLGVKGNVLNAVDELSIDGDIIMACGPMPMLRAIKAYAAAKGIPAYISLEEKMACGIGACLACVCKTKDIDAHSQVNNTRICKEGPVFEASYVEI